MLLCSIKYWNFILINNAPFSKYLIIIIKQLVMLLSSIILLKHFPKIIFVNQNIWLKLFLSTFGSSYEPFFRGRINIDRLRNRSFKRSRYLSTSVPSRYVPAVVDVVAWRHGQCILEFARSGRRVSRRRDGVQCGRSFRLPPENRSRASRYRHRQVIRARGDKKCTWPCLSQVTKSGAAAAIFRASHFVVLQSIVDD